MGARVQLSHNDKANVFGCNGQTHGLRLSYQLYPQPLHSRPVVAEAPPG